MVLGMAATNVWSYGGGGGGYSTTCKPPAFKNIKPPKVVAPGGEIFFTASSNTDPKSIKVTAKGHKLELNIEDHYGYHVSANMPVELTEGYARIKISANSTPKSCITEGGWLLKIGD